MLVPLRIIPAKSVFAHLQFTRLWYFRTNASNHCRFAFPFFDSSLCDEFLTHVHIQPFVQLIQIRRFTVLHSLCWLTPSTFIPPSFRLSMCSRLSASPSWVRLCRIAFSVFGLSELGSAMPNCFSVFGLSELGSAMPNCFLGLRLVRHSSIIGVWFSCSNPKHRDFDHQVRYPIQLNPQHLLLWGFVGFGSLQGEI